MHAYTLTACPVEKRHIYTCQLLTYTMLPHVAQLPCRPNAQLRHWLFTNTSTMLLAPLHHTPLCNLLPPLILPPLLTPPCIGLVPICLIPLGQVRCLSGLYITVIIIFTLATPPLFAQNLQHHLGQVYCACSLSVASFGRCCSRCNSLMHGRNLSALDVVHGPATHACEPCQVSRIKQIVIIWG